MMRHSFLIMRLLELKRVAKSRVGDIMRKEIFYYLFFRLLIIIFNIGVILEISIKL